MGALTQAGLFGAMLCFAAMLFAIYKKNALWKQFLFGIVLCLLIFFMGLTLTPFLQEAKNTEIEKPTAPLIKYELQSINAPSQKEVDAWRKGLFCRLTYNVVVESEQPTAEEFRTIALDIIEKDAQQRHNWNIIHFYLFTPASIKTAVAYMEADYALNGKLEQTNKIKPGNYSNKFKVTIYKVN